MRALLVIFFVNLQGAISCGCALSANTLFFKRDFLVQFPLGYFVVGALLKMH